MITYTATKIIVFLLKQTGKTTLSREIIKLSKLKTLSINSDLYDYFKLFDKPNLTELKVLLSGYEFLCI